MAFEHKENTGSLFKNDKKEKDSQPDYKGKANIDGVMKDVAVWVKEGSNGKYFSMSFKPEWKPDSKPESNPFESNEPLPF